MGYTPAKRADDDGSGDGGSGTDAPKK